MKNTFLKKYIVLGALSLLSISGCKDFLDEEPLSSTSEEAVFLNNNSARMAVLGIYNQLAGDNGYGQRLSLVYPFDTDEMMGYSASLDDQRRLNSYDVQPGNTNLELPFNQLYSGIDRANVCIFNIPKMPAYTNGSEAVKLELRRLHGEALTLRAFFYSELIKSWGDVPAHWEPATMLESFDVPKTDRDVIYDRIIEDLKVAAELVPWRGEPGSTQDERLTKGAVKALRARIALFRGGFSLRRETRMMERRPDYLTYYTIARDECAAIMLRTDIHKLNPSFEAVFKDALLAHKIEPNGEVMFEVAMGGETTDADSKIGSINSIRIYSNATGTTGFGTGRNTILPTHFYSFSPYDKRRDVSIAPFNIRQGNYNGEPLSNLLDGKWRRDWISPAVPLTEGRTFYGINWPIIRYSDVLLMFAEAENEISGATTAAVDAVNQVRRRSWAIGAVKSITVTNGGTNYTAIPTLTISGTGGARAVAVIDAVTKKVTRVDIITPGSGYTSAPTITFSGGGTGATGATATTTLTTTADADLTTTQIANFLSTIQEERRLEFTSEGIRKYDLIRWNLLGRKIADTRAELVKMENKTAPYDNYPATMYYVRNSKTGLVWANSFYTPSPAAATYPTASFTAVPWFSGMLGAKISVDFASGFVPNKSELLPLPANLIVDSHGVVTQDYGY